MRDYIFEHDASLIRNRNLSNPVNVRHLLLTALQATNNNARVRAIFDYARYSRGAAPGHPPYDNLILLAIDGNHIEVSRSKDPHLQRRTYSTKIKGNAVVKIRVSDAEGKPLFSTSMMCSLSPTGIYIKIHVRRAAGR